MHTKSDSDVTSSVDPSSPRSLNANFTTSKALPGILTMVISRLPCRQLLLTVAPWNLLLTLLTAVTQGHLPLVVSRELSRKEGREKKGWTECNVIEEEGDYGEYFYGNDKGFTRRCQILMGVFGFIAVFSLFCLIIWGASRPYNAQIAVKSLTVHNFYFGEGADMTEFQARCLQ
ncbi:hypothetical protein ES319_1Z029200v1 [Gossypium barbadense]|uniref:Uncharacterized protein n=1 Tax=Gossypium barbadense TaxID=3634 RepID=A0A5J5NCB5_GOSBA|nr:hypothetical protein ES319_1Z029200v1 [Gossypium barbadense]